MLRTRLLVLIILVPAIVAIIALGGWPMTLALSLILGIAAWEYWRMFNLGGYAPSGVILIGSMPLFVFTEFYFGINGRVIVLTFLVMIAMAFHMFKYEMGDDKAATNFGITVAGLLCIGWLGSYLLPLRNLPDGLWWSLLVYPSVCFADAGAYIFGKLIGRHHLTRRVSPNKTWEGFIGGLIFSVILTSILAYLWHLVAPAITPAKGAIVGLVMGLVPLFGDLGISMIKRQFGLKDTSQIIPGHGGILDRFDTTLWALPLGYYLITWLW